MEDFVFGLGFVVLSVAKLRILVCLVVLRTLFPSENGLEILKLANLGLIDFALRIIVFGKFINYYYSF